MLHKRNTQQIPAQWTSIVLAGFLATACTERSIVTRVPADIDPQFAAGKTSCTGLPSGTSSLTISPANNPTVGVGATLDFNVLNQSSVAVQDCAVSWSVSDSALAAISSAGVVVGKKSGGPITVKVQSTGSKPIRATAFVTIGAAVASVRVNPSTGTLTVGATQQLTASALDAAGTVLTGRTVTWVSSNSLMASISPTGLVTALLPGTVTLTATVEGKAGTSTFTVLGQVATVQVSPATLTLTPSITGQLSAVVRDNAGAELTGKVVTWQSTNSAVATVSATGIVTAISDGSATIRATSEGVSGSAEVRVKSIQRQTLALGSYHTCGLAVSGDTYCWGMNSYGQAPARLAAADFPFVAINALLLDTCGILANGTALCMGDNTAGYLGDGTTIHRSTPTPIAGDLKWSGITSVFRAACGLAISGDTYCWGQDPFFGGAIVPTPTLMSGFPKFSSISQVGFCGITIIGEIYCVDGGPTPLPVGSGMTFKDVENSGEHLCALATSGVAYCRGRGDHGALGNGSWVSADGLVQVSGELILNSITVGAYHSCGLTAVGRAWCWGLNENGQLGDGTLVDRNTPVRVAADLTFATLQAYARRTCGITPQGTMYCWGDTLYGALGTVDGSDHTVPNPVQLNIQFRVP